MAVYYCDQQCHASNAHLSAYATPNVGEQQQSTTRETHQPAWRPMLVSSTTTVASEPSIISFRSFGKFAGAMSLVSPKAAQPGPSECL
jgi:hypothetical protein